MLCKNTFNTTSKLVTISTNCTTFVKKIKLIKLLFSYLSRYLELNKKDNSADKSFQRKVADHLTQLQMIHNCTVSDTEADCCHTSLV